MADEKIIRLAGALYERTKSDAMKWEQTSRENEFQTSFPNYSIEIQRTRQGDLLLKIYNESGQVIEELSDSQAYTLGFKGMPQLFELARRQAMNVDQALDELLGELGSSVGKK